MDGVARSMARSIDRAVAWVDGVRRGMCGRSDVHGRSDMKTHGEKRTTRCYRTVRRRRRRRRRDGSSSRDGDDDDGGDGGGDAVGGDDVRVRGAKGDVRGADGIRRRERERERERVWWCDVRCGGV